MARKPEVRTARKAPVPVKPQKTAKAAKPAPARKTKSVRARKPRVVAASTAVSPAELARELENANRRYYDAFQSLDPDQVERLWWHDATATCVHPGWDVRHGWSDIRASYEEIFGNTRSIRFALGDVRVHVTGEIGIVTCVENLVSQEGDSGDYLGAVLASNVFERRRGEWRIILHHASPFASDEAELPEGPLH